VFVRDAARLTMIVPVRKNSLPYNININSVPIIRQVLVTEENTGERGQGTPSAEEYRR
jgi:hypothetical protein